MMALSFLLCLSILYFFTSFPYLPAFVFLSSFRLLIHSLLLFPFFLVPLLFFSFLQRSFFHLYNNALVVEGILRVGTIHHFYLLIFPTPFLLHCFCHCRRRGERWMLMVRNLSQTQDKCAATNSLRYSEICVGYSVMKLRPQIDVVSLIYRKIELQSIVIDPFKDIEVFTYMAHRNSACIGDSELCF